MSENPPHAVRIVLTLCLGLICTAPLVQAGTIALSAVRDCTLIQAADGLTGNGQGPSFFVGQTNGPSIRRGLIAFDVADHLPPGASIESVALVMHVTGNNPAPDSVSLHRGLDDWGEGGSSSSGGGGAPAAPADATWLYRFFDPGSPGTSPRWTSPGGDFAVKASATVDVAGDGYYSWQSPQMVLDVQTWTDKPAANHGWLVKGSEGSPGTSKRYDSRESPEAALRPVLIVEFTAPTSISDRAPAAAASPPTPPRRLAPSK